jgi:Secretion system C-terminal sorting domain
MLSLSKWLFNMLLLLMSLMASGQGLLLTGGSNLVIKGNSRVVIKDGGFTNNGNFIADNGTVSFTGSMATANSFIGGSSASQFFDLTLSKTSNGMKLNSHIHVANSLNFISGDSLFLNNYNIDLGSTGVLNGECNSRRITGLTGGYIQRTQTLQAASAVNPGNMGIEITSVVDLGNTIVRRGHMLIPGIPAGSISRYYDVIPSNNSELDAIVKFNYLDGETGGLPENNLMLYSSANGGVNWTFRGMSTADMIQNFVTRNDLDQLNMFILADLGTILPVHLVYFNAKLVNRQTLLNWSVIDESAIDHYDIERSTDGINFSFLKKIQRVGTNSGTQYYESIDQYPVKGFNYYRLKMVDVLNVYKYSNIALVKLDDDSGQYPGIFPNPAHDIIKITFTSEKNEQVRIAMFDAKGSLVAAKNVAAIMGRNEISWDIQFLPAGAYVIQLHGSVSKTIQFIKQ